MGCGASRSTTVEEFRMPKVAELRGKSAGNRLNSGSNTLLRRKPASADSLLLREERQVGHQGAQAKLGKIQSATSVVSRRQVKLSKVANGSIDSGLGNDSTFTSEKSLNLANLTGLSLPPLKPPSSGPTSASAASVQIERPKRADASKILQSLREEGLIEATNKGKSGLCYELPLGDLQPAKRALPDRLARLERAKDKPSLEVTKAELKRKLDEANERRKLRTAQALRAARERDQRNLEVKLAILEIDKLAELKANSELTQRLNTAAQRREQAMNTLLQKQMEHNQRGQEVRQRRSSLLATDV